MTPTETQAVALVGGGKVRIKAQTVDVLRGEVEGRHGVYAVTIDPEGAWCECEHGKHRNPHARCSHVLAVEIESVRAKM